MEWLNYHHLLYFWVVAKEGSVVRATKKLGLTGPTISTQVHRLEEVLGEKLFERRGRHLVLTDVGRVAFRYAEEIFSLGREFLDTIEGRASGRQLRLVVGVSDVFPKSMVHRILAPAFRLDAPVRVICREDRSIDAFLGELALQTVDVVLSDVRAPAETPVRAFSHLLGECGTAFLASPAVARSHRRQFPVSLHQAPFLLPGASSALRRSLEEWFDSNDIRPNVVSELDDAALAKVFGEQGLGIFAVPDVNIDDVKKRYKVHLVGRARAIRQRFYAISIERRIRHPGVVAICEVAREAIFK